ncbi:hypothetical protein [uncultured Lamprocystis sp.]|jgi:hypothetical protein|uniref:hypothetical protein n=1 Tax=uncultured Lamprocystis sp. TaxID=543132 RepID=UPI0025ECEFFC|nr:hypothetical protein [uncultured Lamprocystis sp.]
MKAPAVLSTALFLAALALPPGQPAAAGTQVGYPNGRDPSAGAAAVIDDLGPDLWSRGPTSRPLSPQEAQRILDEVTRIIDRSPYAPPSRRLGTRLPKAVDLRGELPPVADRGDLGVSTSVIFATAYYQLSQSLKHFRHPAWNLNNPEHQGSVAFVRAMQMAGGPDDVYQILQNDGTVDRAEMPYNPLGPVVEPTANQLEMALPYRISRHAALWDNGDAIPTRPYDNPTENAKAWLADGFVLSCRLDPRSHPGFPGDTNPPARYFDPATQPGIDPSVGVALVGYNDQINPTGRGAEHRGGFLMVNSRGPRWNGAMHGYLWLSYAYVRRYVRDCSIMVPGGADTPVVTGYTYSEIEKGGSRYSTILITGRNFGYYRRAAEVAVNGVATTLVFRFTNEAIEVIVQSCIKAGPLVVYNWEGTPSNAVWYVPLPLPPTSISE